ELPLNVAALPRLHLDDRLLRHADVAEVRLHPERLDAVRELLDHAVLEAGVRMDDVPVHARRVRRCGGGLELVVLRVVFHGPRPQLPKAEKSLFMSGVTAASTAKRNAPTMAV